MNGQRISRREWLGLAAAGAIAAGCDKTPPPPPPIRTPFSGQPTPDRPNIILFISDTLRADHLSCYGRQPQTSPVIDWMAKYGVLFERTISGSTWTKPSIGTMFTGVPARVHQAVAAEGNINEIVTLDSYRVQMLRDEFQTLAEALKAIGYSTAHIIGNGHGRPEFGYGRGFDFVNYSADYFIGAQVNDAIDWIWNAASEPFFLVIHQIDPHGPYTPTEDAFYTLHGVTMEEASAVMKPEEAEIVLGFLESYRKPSYRTGVETVSPEANEYFKMVYDAEIFSVDSNLKRLIHHLRRIEVLDHTIFTFTSDHGEGFREHGFYGHGSSLPYNELLHVPLVFSGGSLPQGVRVPYSTSMIDLFPTLLELAGGTSKDYVTGAPMLSRKGDVLVNDHRIAYSDLDYHSADLNEWDACIVHGKYKVASQKAKDEYWIFDLETDPGEFDNLAGTGKLPEGQEQSLIAMLHEQIDRYETLRQEFGEPVWMEAADGVHEELQALGYL